MVLLNFPAIYNLVVPGLRYIQWASLENFEVSLLGNRRKIGNHIIPEAYVCQFTFRSLTVEPANFIDEICEERSELGSFEAYSANQLEEELEFQKGRGQREREFASRSELANAVNNARYGPLTEAEMKIVEEMVNKRVPYGGIGSGAARYAARIEAIAELRGIDISEAKRQAEENQRAAEIERQRRRDEENARRRRNNNTKRKSKRNGRTGKTREKKEEESKKKKKGRRNTKKKRMGERRRRSAT